MTYDALGRLEERFVPSTFYEAGSSVINSIPMPYGYGSGLTIDSMTAVFTYDAMGNMLTADNAFSEVTRTYTLDGLIASEEQDLAAGTFLLRYHYDRDRRRAALEHRWARTRSRTTPIT
jgi:hypothetical protein